jgi:hypothetical protein
MPLAGTGAGATTVGKEGGTNSGGLPASSAASRDPNPVDEAGASTDSKEATGVAVIGGKEGIPRGSWMSSVSPRDAGGTKTAGPVNTGRPRNRDSNGH